MNPGQTDEELMIRVQQGDSTAYQVLFKRHQGRVYGFLRRRVVDPDSAADVFQETFLRVHRSSATWRRGHPFRPWLYGIAANAARDHARKIRRTPEVRVEDDALERAAPVVRNHSDARLHLQDAIAELPDSLREAFLLGVVEGFDHNELADLLEISPANARARVSRARARLRESLRSSDAL